MGACEEASGVVYRSHMGRAFEIHTYIYDVLLSYKHDIAYDVSQYPSGVADLCFFFNSGHEASSSDPEQHKQFYVRAYSFHRLFLVFFRGLSLRNQLRRIWSALDLEGHLFNAVVSFCFFVSQW